MVLLAPFTDDIDGTIWSCAATAAFRAVLSVSRRSRRNQWIATLTAATKIVDELRADEALAASRHQYFAFK
jgi:hypothetical protein